MDDNSGIIFVPHAGAPQQFGAHQQGQDYFAMLYQHTKFDYLCIMDKKRIIKEVRRSLKPINIHKVILFGSYSTGNQNKNSDIELSENNTLFITTINEVYIDSRYPGNMGLMPQGKPTLEDAKEFIEFTEAIFLQNN